MTTTIQVRTDQGTKKAAQQILQALGLDLSTAINIYLVQIIEKHGIPFPIVTENGLSEETEKSILKDLETAKKSRKSFSSAKSMHRAILSK